MVAEKFRYQLRKELEQWLAEGIINRALYEQLADRYQFAELDQEARNRFVMNLLGLGSILLGLAAITFVAANWQFWTRSLKVFLLLSLFIGVNTAGFYLWRHRSDRWQTRLGEGLLLLGSLILGANLALMSQMFHSSGAVYQLYLLWGLGVLAMAYGLRLEILGIVAIILIVIGYSQGITDLFYISQISGFQLSLQHMPLLASLLFVPLAYRCRSQTLFGLSVILVIYSLEINLSEFIGLSSVIGGVIAAIACALPPALLWAYSDTLWFRHRPSQSTLFDPIARNIAVVYLGIIFYVFSFHFFWDSSSYSNNKISLFDWLTLLDAAFLSGLTVFAWWRLGYRNSNRSLWRIDSTSTAIGVMITITALIFGWHLSIESLGTLPTFIFNLLLFLLVVGLMRQALATGTRDGFWSGIILLVLQLVSRMLEYDTGLLFKALILFLCGVGIIAAGLWFERYLQTFNSNSSAR